MSGWWRENRWWLPALPLAVTATAAASSYLLHDYWWIKEPRHEISSAAQGHYVTVTDDYSDYLGTLTHTFQVRLAGVVEVDKVVLDSFELDGPQPTPEGLQSLRVHLDWRADPDQILRGCEVALVDSEGRRYEQVDRHASDACVPPGRGGPEPAAVEGDVREVPDGEDRPPTWSTNPQFLVPQGVEITQVLVWWELPDYVRLDVS